MSSELEAALLAANGETLYIPEGRYLLKNMSVAADIRVIASPRAVFINQYTTDTDARCIRQRNDTDAQGVVDILDIDNIIWFFSEATTRIRVADASVFSADDIVHIHSQNGSFEEDLTESDGDIRRVGQSARIAEVDLINDYIYLYGSLEWTPKLVTNPKIRVYSTRVFEWDGGVFESDDPDAVIDPLNNDQGFRRPFIEVYATPFTKIKNVTFRYGYAQNIMLRSCPYSLVENTYHYGTPNLRLPSEPYVGRTGTYSSGSTAVTVSSTTNSSIAVGKSISGTGIPDGTYIAAYSHPDLTLSQATTSAGTSETLTIELKYFITGVSTGTNVSLSATTTADDTVILMADTTGLSAGMEISGTGIVPNTFILSVDAGVSITVNEAPTSSATITLTGYQGITITVSAADTLSNNDIVLLDDLGGMTGGNGRFYQVTGKAGTSFKLYDYFGGGALNPSAATVYRLVSGRGWGTYTSGGAVRETGGGDTSLAYGVQLYGACCKSLVRDNVFHNMRHCVTTDGLSGNTYSATEWMNYGATCNALFINNVSYDAHGASFDTHQEGLNNTFIDCHSLYPNRGSYWQTSYAGTGFHDRSGSTTFIDCSVIGGVRGFRVSRYDNVLASEGRMINCTVKNNRSLQDEDGQGVIFTPEIRKSPFKTRYIIKNMTITGCGTGIECLTSSSNSSAGGALDLIVSGLSMNGVKVGMDLAPNVYFTALDKITYDLTGSAFTGSHYFARMRSTADITRTGTLSDGAATVTSLSATSDLYIGSYVIGTGIPTGAKIKSIDSASQITLDVDAFASGATSLTIRSTSNLFMLDGMNISENHEHPLNAILYQSDTNATKYYYYPSGSLKVISAGIGLKTFTDAEVTTGTDTVEIVAHGFSNREEVRVKIVSGTIPTGLAEGTTYYIFYVDADNIRFYTDKALSSLVDITGAGSGTFSVQRVPMITTNNTTNTLTVYGDAFTL